MAEFLDSRPTIAVDDFAAALAFWTEACGFDVEVSMGEPADFAIIRSGSACLGLASTSAPSHPDIAVTYLTVNGIEDLLGRFEARGVDVVVPLTERPWGLRDAVVRVPGGPLVAFGEPT
jgi:predicted enzyme related to lactoylglutathione lyase